MSLTWLEMCQTAADELGLTRPTVIAGALDAQSRQLGALANRIGGILLRRQSWTFLQNSWVITTTEPITMTATVEDGSAVVTGLSDTSSIVAGAWVVSALYFAQNPRVLSVDSPSQVTLDTKATSSGSVYMVFAQDTYDVPPDFLNFLDETGWDRTRRWQLLGPTSPSQDEALRSGIIAPVPRVRWRQIGPSSGATFRIWPAPTSTTAPSTLIFDYLSYHWAADSLNNSKSKMTADTDTAAFADDLMVTGIQWLFMQQKGFDFMPLRTDWERQVGSASAVDGGAPDLSLNKKRIWDPLDPAAVNVVVQTTT